MKKKITISLEEDTAEFLALLEGDLPDAHISQYINSLLRQERFRQGYPSGGIPEYTRMPVTSQEEQEMLRRSGLLPLPARRPVR